MKRTPFVLAALVIALLFSGGYASAAEITIRGKSEGSAAAGPYTRGGMMEMSTAPQVRRQADYIMRYNGPTDFTADYNIVLKQPGNMLDTDRSTVKFNTINFTADGRLVEATGVNMFMTQPIKITEVMFMDGDPTMIASFKFSSMNWYPENASGANGLNNLGLMGEINLKTMTSSYTAAYSLKQNGVISSYMVMNRPADPFPPDDPVQTDGPPIFSPLVPEPTTWIMILTAFGGFALHRRRR